MRTPMLLILLALPLGARAEPTGIAGYSGRAGSSICTSCHTSGATAPTVAIAGPATLTAGQSSSYTLTVSGGPAANAGMDVSLGGVNSGGAVLSAGTGTKILNAEVVHSGPAAFAGGTATFTFTVKAPLTAGVFTLSGAGLSSNNSSSTSGDGVGKTALDVTVQLPPGTSQPDAGTMPVTPTPDAGTAPKADGGSTSPTAALPVAGPTQPEAAPVSGSAPLSDGLVEGDAGCSSTGGLPLLGLVAMLARVWVRRSKQLR